MSTVLLIHGTTKIYEYYNPLPVAAVSFFLSVILKNSLMQLYKKVLFYTPKKCTTYPKKNYSSEGFDSQGLGWFYVDEKCFQKGNLFPVGSFGHTGFTGTSMFFNREFDMYVIMLTNATRFSNIKNNFNGPDYNGDTCRIRVELHNSIFDDLKTEKLL